MAATGVRSHTWRKLRQHWRQQLPLPCCRCGVPILPGDPFDLDHLVRGNDASARPAHPRCNRSAGAAFGNDRRRQKRAAEKAWLQATGFHWDPNDPLATNPRQLPVAPDPALLPKPMIW